MIPETTVRISPAHVSCGLGDEAAVLNLRTGHYYGLDSVSARIWELMREPTTIAAIRDAIVNEYDVPPERCEQDLFHLLRKLAAAGLIETVPS